MRKKYIDEGLEIVGNNNKFQIIICILLVFIGISGDIIYSGMPLMETTPIININNTVNILTQLEMNYTLCNSTYTIDKTETKSSWVSDYKLYCDKFLVSLLGSVILLGGLTGSIIIQILKHKGAKFNLILVCSIMSLSGTLLVFNNLPLFYIFLFLNGLSGIVIFIIKINIMTEITHKSYRSYYNNILITANNISLMINYFLFNFNFNWKVIYFLNSICTLILTIIFYKVYIESPRFYHVNFKKEMMISSLLYIAKFNGKDRDLNFKEKIENYLSEGKNNNEIEMSKKGNIEGKEVVYSIIGNNNYSEVENSSKESITTDTKFDSFPNNKNKIKYTYLNFILSYPIGNFLYFLYMLQIKEYSYYIDSVIYIFCIISLLFSFALSPLMNLLGRKYSKIILLNIFTILFIVSKFIDSDSSLFINIYLINRLILHSNSMINHTHINEYFPSTNRLKLFGFAFTLSKLIIIFAPFIYEYLKPYNTLIILSTSAVLLLAYSMQNETANKSLEDF